MSEPHKDMTIGEWLAFIRRHPLYDPAAEGFYKVVYPVIIKRLKEAHDE